MEFYDKVKTSADFISERVKERPSMGIILGSGLGELVELMEDKEIITYRDIPYFPVSKVEGHAGNLVIGRVGTEVLMVMQGRFHYYEGFSMRELTYPVFVMKLLGVEKLIVTNACGGINRSFHPGDLMLITDFINTAWDNPLIGDNDERFGLRFPDMSEPYSRELIELAKSAAGRLSIEYKEGVYAMHQGPYYETAAEIRMYERIGADAVGMSTVPETIAASYLGIKTLAIACITNMATGIRTGKHSHEEVLRIAAEAGDRLLEWVKEIIVSEKRS